MCSYVLTLASKVSRDRRVVTRGSGRANEGTVEANGNGRAGKPGSGMKRIAPGLCVPASSPGGELVAIYQTEFCLLLCATVRY